MTTDCVDTYQSKISVEIEKMLAAYSETDQEALTGDLLDIVRSSQIVKILDETQPSGPGTLKDVLRICSALGKVDASLAWIVGVSNSAWSMRSCFQSFESDALLAMEQNKMLAMVLGRPGSLRKDETGSGYRLKGEWRYSSGSTYASFFFCLAAVEGSNFQDVRVVAVPAEKLTVIGPWQATGLRGTQSVTLQADDIRIPESQIIDYASVLSGKKSSALNKFTEEKHRAQYTGLFTGVLMNCLLGAVLGATQAGLAYVAAAVAKYPLAGSTYSLMSDSGAIRAELGRLRSTLDLYERAAEYNADVIDEVARNPDVVLTTQERVDCRARATQIMRGCVNIVQDLLWIYGSSGLDKGNPLEKIWRDVNVGARHGGFSKFVPEEALGLLLVERDPKTITRMF